MDLGNQTLFWLEPISHKKMAESAGDDPFSYRVTLVYIFWILPGIGAADL